MYAEAFAATKVALVEGHDMITTGLDGQLENHVVAGILQVWSPKKEDPMQPRNATMVIQHIVHNLIRDPQIENQTV